MAGLAQELVAMVGAEEGKDKADNNKKPELKTSRSKTKDFDRAMDFVKDLKMPEGGKFQEAFTCFVKYGVKPLIVICMAYIWVGKKLYWVYKKLPTYIWVGKKLYAVYKV